MKTSHSITYKASTGYHLCSMHGSLQCTECYSLFSSPSSWSRSNLANQAAGQLWHGVWQQDTKSYTCSPVSHYHNCCLIRVKEERASVIMNKLCNKKSLHIWIKLQSLCQAGKQIQKAKETGIQSGRSDSRKWSCLEENFLPFTGGTQSPRKVETQFIELHTHGPSDQVGEENLTERLSVAVHVKHAGLV